MNTKQFILKGSRGQDVLLIAPENIVFPTYLIEHFPHCCGAGEGIGDLLVPESVFGVIISAACFIHDFMWDNMTPSWEYFHASNSIFRTNMSSIINTESGNCLSRKLRMIRIMEYYEAVDHVGAIIFWSQAKRKGLI